VTAPSNAGRGRPLVGVSCCVREINGGQFHAVVDKYLLALLDHAGCMPLLVPAMGAALVEALLLDHLLARLDGVLLTGGRSMVAPEYYGAPPCREGVLHDRARDATTLPLARRCVDQGVPLLGICRGLQEICAAFGGALETHLHERPDRRDHRAPRDTIGEARYRHQHTVTCVPGGQLAVLAERAGAPSRFDVNSLHEQGIERLGPHLSAEAYADDGLIEAISVPAARSFALAVQWHPEWFLDENPVNRSVFAAFGEACRRRAAERSQDALRAARKT